MKSDYRPMNLTSTFSKILGFVMSSKIREALEKHEFIKLPQCALLKGFSYLTNLLSYYSNVYEEVDSGKEYDTVCLDISKAFDTALHEKLIRKIKSS